MALRLLTSWIPALYGCTASNGVTTCCTVGTHVYPCVSVDLSNYLAKANIVANMAFPRRSGIELSYVGASMFMLDVDHHYSPIVRDDPLSYN